MNFNFGTAYYVVNEYKNVKRYVSIAIQGDFVFGVRFMESSKYTLLELLNDLCKRSKEDGYTGIRLHHKDECFNTYEEAARSIKKYQKNELLDKVKKAREEIEEKAFTEEIFDEDIFNSMHSI